MPPEFAEVGAGYVTPDLDAEWRKCRDWHLANGKGTASVRASYRTWFEKAVEFGRASRKNPDLPLAPATGAQPPSRYESPEDRSRRAIILAWVQQGEGDWHPAYGDPPTEAEVTAARAKVSPDRSAA